jgi:alkylation response protein AidB-like acyl-CoA dehydrogenase
MSDEMVDEQHDGAAKLATLRSEIRAFLDEELADRTDFERADGWQRFDLEFSEKLGARGFLGMCLPKIYGGGERSMLERYVVQEEVIAAAGPILAHWVGERQSGPLINKIGSDEQKQRYLPSVSSSKLTFAIGMSEPGSGSDLASVRTRAERTANGWLLNGSKIWTSYAHLCDVAITLARTEPRNDTHRHAGLSQFIVDLDLPGITISPMYDIVDELHFTEVHFENVELPESALLGEEGNGWNQVVNELSLERSGSDRFLSTMPLISEFSATVRMDDQASVDLLAELFADLVTLREMSLDIVGAVAQGQDVNVQAAMVKDLGAQFEQGSVEEIARLRQWDGTRGEDETGIPVLLSKLSRLSICFTIRGGAREVLRGIVGKGLSQ